MITWEKDMSAFDFIKAKYEAKEEVTEKEFLHTDLAYCASKEQSEGSGRWDETILCVYSQDDEHYGLWYEKGLTECQEDYFDKQVPKKLKAKQVVITEYEVDNG